ncbi:MAG TPA: Uma2 family endonuclease [Blastocatellia bacterium]|nr:Uma2 family endonuclease [Blastocatellia bacterium]
MSVVAETLMTAEEFAELPDDGERYELVEGRLEAVSLPGWEHGEIVMELAFLIKGFARERKLGTVFAAETAFRLQSDPDTVRGPDVAFVSNERIPTGEVDRRKPFPAAPDLAVEVISPNDVYTKVRKKIDEYLKAGTKLVWIVDPSVKEVEVWRADRSRAWLTETDVLDGESVLPGFQIAVRDLFLQS